MVVRPGEVLYLPFGWWHQVRAIPAQSGLCASAAFFYEPFFCRFQPRTLPRPGPVLPNPKYRTLCERLGLGDSDEEEAGGDPAGRGEQAVPRDGCSSEEGLPGDPEAEVPRR